MEKSHTVTAAIVFLQVICVSAHSHMKTSTLGSVDFGCPSDSIFGGGYCYMPVSPPMTWRQADLACKSEGFQLCWIEDGIENDFVADTVMAGMDQYWIGLSGSTTPNDIVWSWYRGESSKVVSNSTGLWANYQPDTESGNCVSTDRNSNSRWTFSNCWNKLPFVCKRQATPFPADAYMCYNGKNINKKWKCDGYNDCGDDSDEINCQSRCSNVVSLSSGETKTLTTNATNYKDQTTCTWLLEAPIGTRIKLEVSAGYNLEENADYLKVWTGAYTLKESAYLGRITGTGNTARAFYSSNHFMLLQLSTDYNVLKAGFNATFTAGVPELTNDLIKVTANNTWGVLSSPFYPAMVPYELTMLWLISGDEANVLTIEIESVDLPDKAVLQILDGASLTSPSVYMPSLTSVPDPAIYISRSSEICILLSSESMYESSTKSKGFRLKYRNGCKLGLSREAGKIESPGFMVGGYPDNIACEWNITAPQGENQSVSLRITEIMLKDSDLLMIYNNENTALHTGDGFSGNTQIDTTFSSAKMLRVMFTSNLVLTDQGFKAEFSIDCPKLQVSQWTTITGPANYTSFETEIMVSCKAGYSFKQEDYNMETTIPMLCESGGMWNVTRIPDCQITYCGAPRAIDNGILTASTGAFYGSNATYGCNGGFTLTSSSESGTDTVLCKADGMWQTPPSCAAKSCVAKSAPDNGYINVTGNGTNYATVVEFGCNPGYEVVGHVTIYCKTDGTWSGSSPTCKKLCCAPPRDIRFGSVTGTSRILYDDKVDLVCDPGFVIRGTSNSSAVLTCTADGLLVPRLECVDEDDCEADPGPCVNDVNTHCVNTIGSHVCLCNEGYSRAGGDCENINECNIDNGGCSDNCTDDSPGYHCECPMGKELYAYPGFNNISLPMGEDGKRPGDVYYINHTCVPKLCPKPEAPANGMILSKKDLFYYGDEVQFHCNYGYVLKGSKSLNCMDSGWDKDVPTCEIGHCIPPMVRTNVNRVIPAENMTVAFGEEFIVECIYGSKLVNRTLYCTATGSAADNFELQGDDPECPVIDCGTPEVVLGSNYGTIQDKLLNDSFMFSCENGYTPSGQSSAGDQIVRCQETGRWDFGTLTCVGAKCTDPGTPGDAEQIASSYEVGQSVSFNCSRIGYEPRPADPLLCEVVPGTSNVTWNATELPTCTDVTPPSFINCTKDTIYIDKTQKVMYQVPSATDNSGAIKTITVDPPNFTPNTVVSQDMCITYTAMDYSGNSATCRICVEIKPRSFPEIMCPNRTEELIETVAGKMVDLQSYVMTNPNKTLQISYSPSQMLKLNSSTLDKPLEVSVNVADKWGTSVSCSFLVVTKAKFCFRESFPSTLRNASIDCTGSSGLACTVTCADNHVLDDGNTNRTYTCTGENQWTPSLPPKACIPYESPEYLVKAIVNYGTSINAAPCVAAHEEVLKANNATINTILTSYCNIATVISVGDIIVREITTTAQSSILNTVITAKLLNGTSEKRGFCASTFLKLMFDKDPDSLLYVPSLTCENNETATLTSNTLTVPKDYGNKCVENTQLQLQNTVDGEKCVPCPPGTFVSSDVCTMCGADTYQDMEGQTTCKSCPENQIPSDDRTYCIDMCPPGYRSEDGVTHCEACPVNCYWVNATFCQLCPDGSSTVYTEAAKTKMGCKAPCQPGSFSVTGFEPCSLCPLHHFQTMENATSCEECSGDSVTKEMGSNSSSDCMSIVDTACNSSESNCNNNGECVILNHMKTCNCSSGYTGADCSEMIDPCASQPCFNGGTCTMIDSSTYNCSCREDVNCTMTQTPQAEGTDSDREKVYTRSSVQMCEQDCIDDTSCISVHYTDGYCYIFYKPTTIISNKTNSVYSQKSCVSTELFEGARCDVDLINSCQASSCGQYGMCKDELDDMYTCLCPVVGEYKGPKCELDVDLCDPDPCRNGASCMSFGSVRSQCMCLPGYTGAKCENNINECEINTKACLYNGTCKDRNDSYTCDCETGFSGSNCQDRANFCDLDPCSNGLCYNNFDTFSSECVCEPPYEKGSGGKCEEIDKCRNVNCVNGTCSSATGKCVCMEGFEGSLCQHSVDDCKNMTCMNNGTCVDGDNSYTCTCAEGYEGANCSANIDDCLRNTCYQDNTESCNDGLNEFFCRCKDGYSGPNCTTEIDECLSCPCRHDGTCTDLIADYKCTCTPGWTGKNCDMKIDYCNSSLCKNAAECYNLQSGRFCRCNAGTRGDDCDFSPDVCTIANPCAADGTCSLGDDGMPKCTCTSNHTGEACQLLKNHCLANVCQNDGECKMTESNYVCTCKSGFSGANCVNVVRACDDFTCPSVTHCVAGDFGPFCHCPEGKVLTGSVCKDIYPDFDAVFDASIGMDGWKWTTEGIWSDAATPQEPIMYSTGNPISLMFWVKFEDEDQVGVPSIFQLSTPSFTAIDIDNRGITLNNKSETSRLNFTNSLGDGNWHHVGFIWISNMATLVVDAIRIADKKMAVRSALPNIIYSNVGVKFTGRVSAVSLWEGELSFNEIILSKGNMTYRPSFKPLIQTWAGYNFGKGERVYPSAIPNNDICDSPACYNGDKESPEVENCGPDVMAYSPDRVHSITDLAIKAKFKGSTGTENTLPEDNTYTWGAYREAFVAKDDEGNFATCLFNVYIRYYENCPAPMTTSDVGFCAGSNDDICSLTCSSSGFAISQPVPKQTRCGVLGVYIWNKPRYGFALPNCGVEAAVKMKVMASMKYQFGIPCDSAFETSFKTGMLTKFRDDISTQWPDICDTTCSALEVSAKCGTQNDIDITIEITDLPSKINKTGSAQDYTPEQALKVIILVDDKLTFSAIANAALVKSSVTFNEEESCAEGFGQIQDKCVQCAVGSFYNSSTQSCEFCPMGTYQNNAGQSSCKDCSSGRTTESPGAYDETQCYSICAAGQYNDKTVCKPCAVDFYQSMPGKTFCEPCPLGKITSGICAAGQYNDKTVCKPCAVDFYQSMPGKTFCEPCPLGKITSGTGSNSSSLCYDDCPSGTELTASGTCMNCSMGFYRSLNEKSCTSCNSTFTTPREGSKSSAECKIRKCYAGTYRDTTSNDCKPCPYGQYQSMNLSESCEECDDNYSTRNTGRDKKSDCEFFCKPGSEVLSAVNESCAVCDRGYYKDDSDKFGKCMKCPGDNTTDDPGADRESLCSVKICTMGQFVNGTQCQNCPLDTFQAEELPKSNTTCQPCRNGTATKQMGSTNSSFCLFVEVLGEIESNMDVWSRKGNLNPRGKNLKVQSSGNTHVGQTDSNHSGYSPHPFFCKPGSELLSAVNESCAVCDRGYYKDDSDKFGKCMKCPGDNTTDYPGADRESLCSVKICKMGQFVNGTQCQNCPLDTFQAEELPKSNTTCQPCPDGTATKQMGSTNSSFCLAACEPGEHFNGVKCEKCPMGTWNSGNFTMKFEQCEKCPENYTTPVKGAVSEADCTLLDCDPGYQIKGNSCEPCGYGFYQEMRHQNTCVPCNVNLNTSVIAATSEAACQTYCVAGQAGQNNCTKCPENTYKPSAGLSACMNCTGNYTSNNDRTACDVLICDSGFYYNTTTCKPCPVGTYKEQRGRDTDCQKCDAGFTTSTVASTSSISCSEPFCVPGQYLDTMSNMCVNCTIGTYKNSTGNENCTACDSSKTTPTVGSTDSSNCSVVVCEAGQKRLNISNTCQDCPAGQYQPARGSDDCMSCAADETTMGSGKTSQTDCVALCSEGEEFNTAQKRCDKCPLGLFKATPGNTDMCMPCTGNKTTNTTGATSSADCNIDDCAAGSYRSSGGCTACAKGTYQPSKSQTSCINCSSSLSTETEGATSEERCLKNCSAGQQIVISSNTCEPCLKNYYRDVSASLFCIPCRNGYFTYGTGSLTCNQIPPGTTSAPTVSQNVILSLYLEYNVGGLDCSDNTARVLTINAVLNVLRSRVQFLQGNCQCLCGDSSCTQSIAIVIVTCQVPSSAGRRKRSTDATVQFKADVPGLLRDVVNPETDVAVQVQQYLGQDVNRNIQEYTPSGFTNPVVSVNQTTAICNPGSILSTDGQTCNMCGVGTYNDNNAGDCKACPMNQYQEQEGQTSCVQCPGSVKIYTMAMGSNASSDCVSVCVTDSSYCGGGGTCTEDNLSVFCECKENYSGSKCLQYTEPESDRKYIIGGAIGGVAALMLIIIIIVAICSCFRKGSGSSKKTSVYEPDIAMSHNNLNYNHPFVVYDNPKYSFSKMSTGFARPNSAYVSEDEAYYHPGQEPFPKDEEDSMFRWEPAE